MVSLASFQVRRAVAADAPCIFEIAQSTKTTAKWPQEKYKEIFTQGSNRLAFVIESMSEVKGFLVAHQLGDEIEIENIAIERSLQDSGLGSQLLKEFIKLSQNNARTIFLEVRESNRAARALYGKCGFEQFNRRTRYYSHPEEDAILYRLVMP